MSWLSPLRELVGFVFPLLEHVPVIRAILGFALVLFLPGFAWTLVFFRQMKVLERVVISFGLSIVVVTLSLFSVNLLAGVKITGFNSALVLIIITVLPLAVYYLSRLLRGRGGKAA